MSKERIFIPATPGTVLVEAVSPPGVSDEDVTAVRLTERTVVAWELRYNKDMLEDELMPWVLGGAGVAYLYQWGDTTQDLTVEFRKVGVSGELSMLPSSWEVKKAQ